MTRREFTGALLASAASLPFLTTRPAMASSTTLLTAGTRTIEVKGRAATVFGLLQPDGTHGVRLEPGADFNVALANALDAETLIHWHGMTPPWPLDGVPDMPAAPMKPGEQRVYNFAAGAPGTHWMHAHTLQEQGLLAAPLIVYGKEDRARDEQDAVVLLHDFSFTPPEEIIAKLRAAGGVGGVGMGHAMGTTMGGATQDMMAGMDVNDIDYDAYLANDRTLDDPEILRVSKGGRLRLRIINGATATGFTIDTGNLVATVVAVDGRDVLPIAIKQFPLSMGQRVDLNIDIPREGGAFPVLALREGGNERTGVILATPGAKIQKIAGEAETRGPLLSLDVERQLQAARPLMAKAPDRKLSVMLMGDMMGYQWRLESAGPLIVEEGQRVSIEMMNHSMMAHPMHLHGHHFQVMAINGAVMRGAIRDTVLVPPMSTVGIAFDALNSGRGWAFHCHNLYHMAAGMMAAVSYKGA